MDGVETLRLVYETHIEASLAYDERRFTLLQSYIAGVTVVFAFWFNVADQRRRQVLFLPLTFFTVIATFFAAYLVYRYSSDSHRYFFYAEEMIYRAYDTELGVREPPAGRAFFSGKWPEANCKFMDRKLLGTLALWVGPIVVYSGALLTLAYLVRKTGLSRGHAEPSGDDS